MNNTEFIRVFNCWEESNKQVVELNIVEKMMIMWCDVDVLFQLASFSP